MEHDGTKKSVAERAAQLPRLCWQTAEVARSLGVRPDALRRLCERRAKIGPDGELVAFLEHGIVARKRGERARWRFVVPQSLLATASGSGDVGRTE